VTPTYIRKRKRPQGSGLWPAYLIDTDAFGTWFYTPARSLYRANNGEFCEMAQLGPGGEDAHAVGLVSDAERDAAEQATRTLEHDLAAGVEPFGRVGWDRLAAAVALGLPPLTEFGDRPLD
jgi:hypothetical protein